MTSSSDSHGSRPTGCDTLTLPDAATAAVVPAALPTTAPPRVRRLAPPPGPSRTTMPSWPVLRQSAVRRAPAAPPAAPGATNATLGAVMALAAAALFAVNGTASKIVLGAGVSSLRLVQLRSLGAALCLLALVAVTRPGALRTSWRELGFLAVYGVTGVALVQWFYFVAIARLPVGIALLLEYTAPVLVALWVRFVRHAPVRPRVWGALALALAGLALVAQVWEGATLDPVGVTAGLAAAGALAAYYLLGERGLGSRDALSLSAWTFTFSALLWTVVQPMSSLPVDALAAPAPLGVLPLAVPVWVLTLGIVVFGTVAPFLLAFGSIRHLGAARVGLLGMAEPVAAGVVAWVVLGELLTPVQLAGAAVVLVGIVLAETSRRTRVVDAPLPEGIAP